jgi:hypothetical protein
MTWHRDRTFELTVDPARGTLTFPAVLPEVSARSELFHDFQAFLRLRQSEQMPAHRRTDPHKAGLSCAVRKGDLALTLTVRDGDFSYGTRKLISLVHEVYLVFLYDGKYYQYMIDVFDLDPDHL